MKQSFVVLLLVAVAVGLCVPPVFAQATTTVKGVCKDVTGKPYVGATVELSSAETGRKYQIKTNNKGEYFSLGIAPSKYKVSLIVNGQVVFYLNNVNVSLQQEENVVDIDLQKERAAQQPQMTEEQRKAQEQAQKEAGTVKTLNDKLAAARLAMNSASYDQAVALMTEATQIDPNRDLIWFTLGEAYRGQGKAIEKTDRAAAQKSYEQAATAYEKAIAIKPTGAYYNNAAEVFGKAGNMDEAIKAYTQAATLDPAGAGQYYFNLGAVLTNNNRLDDAVAAFQKAIAADPARADAYYWLGVNLVGKATTDKSGKVIAVAGTAEALNKYLELQPTGPYAEGAKGMLQYIGSTIETSYGTPKKKPAPKK